MKRAYLVSLLAGLLLYLFTALVAAAERPPGLIDGVVRNGTQAASAASVRGLQVVVRAVEADGREGVSYAATTNDAGEFRVADVETTQGRKFVATVEYRSIVYRSDLLAFPAEATRLDLPLDIFETTESDDVLRIERAHVLVEFEGEHLLVTEMFVVENAGDRTFVGRMLPLAPTPTPVLAKRVTPTPARAANPARITRQPAAPESEASREILRISLPTGVSEVQFQDDALSVQSRVENNELILLQPLPPQRSQIIFSYLIPRERDAAAFDVAFPLAVQAVNVLVADVGARATVEGLAPREAVTGETPQMRFVNFGGENLPSGEKLTIRVSQIPKEIQPRLVDPPPPPVANIWAWAVLALSVPALGLGVWSARRVRKILHAKP